MPTSRRYTWLYRVDDHPTVRDPVELGEQALKFLTESCLLTPQFYSDPEIKGGAFGLVQISLTVTSDHQWRIRWRLRHKLLPALALAIGVYPIHLMQVEESKLPPHRHPNRAARWRGAA